MADRDKENNAIAVEIKNVALSRDKSKIMPHLIETIDMQEFQNRTFSQAVYV